MKGEKEEEGTERREEKEMEGGERGGWMDGGREGGPTCPSCSDIFLNSLS